jgi:hypothetical protein
MRARCECHRRFAVGSRRSSRRQAATKLHLTAASRCLARASESTSGKVAIIERCIALCLVAHDTRSMWLRLTATLLVFLAACGLDAEGVRQAETLPTPFPGAVLAAHATNNECSPDGCQFVYRVRITNPTDRDANVQECVLIEPPQMRLPVMGIGGLAIRANSTRTASARFVLSIGKDAAKDLVGQDVSCVGLDWHGDPPI